MAYTTIDKPSDYFDTVLYTGNAGTLNITSLDFQPDWIWGKDRSGDRHFLADSVRGKKNTGYHLLCSNNNQADTSNAPPDGITAIGSNGFTLGANTSNTDGGWSFEINESPDSGQGNSGTYVAWNWKAGGSASNNTDGGITSSVSVNQDAGFSIATWTGTGSTATIGHGLNAVPKVIITKARSDAYDWYTYHASIGNTKAIYLNLTNAESGASANFWNNTTPTSSVWTAGGNVFNNNYTFVTYSFAEKQGYSKFGSYTGNNNADGTFVYTGFKPAWIMVKDSSEGSSNWVMFDNKRDGYNQQNNHVFSNTSGAEVSSNADYKLDFLSNGFKFRGNSGDINGTATYIYMAFAENPFVTSTGVPATAR